MVKQLIAVAVVCLSAGCSGVDSAGTDCEWATPTIVEGEDGRPGIRAKGRCRGRMFAVVPVDGQIRCTATISLPSYVTATN